jgi:tetratricopeptide (TPR) repeat protein
VDEHPSTVELRRFAEGKLPKEGARKVVAHIFQGCRPCSQEAARYNLMRLRRTARTRPEPSYRGYGPAIDRAFSAVLHLLPVLGDGSAATPGDALRCLAGPALVDSLLDLAWSIRYQEPGEMVRLARTAVLAAVEIQTGTMDPLQLADLRCRAWAGLGNAYRVNDDLLLAEDALARAADFLGKGSGNPFLKARIYEFQASLYGAQRSFDQAQSALDAAASMYVELGELHKAGRVLISKGLHAGYSHQPHLAVLYTGQGLELLDETADPDLFFIASHNQLWFLVECSRFHEARELLRSRQPLRAGNRLNALKLQWLEGRIAAGLDELALAADRLAKARLGFESAGLRYNSSLIALDLAATLLRLGRPREAREIIAGAARVFAELEVSREALAAALVLRAALENEIMPLLLVTRAADLLRRTALVPDLSPRHRFEPAEN